MPGYKTHAIGGVATFVVCLYAVQQVMCQVTHPLLIMSLFFTTILGALFPDIDTKSKGQMMFYQSMALYLLILLWYKKLIPFMITTCVIIIPLLIPHRGALHNIQFLTFLTGLALMGTYFLFPHRIYLVSFHLLFFLAGAISHVLLDRMQTGIKKMVQ